MGVYTVPAQDPLPKEVAGSLEFEVCSKRDCVMVSRVAGKGLEGKGKLIPNADLWSLAASLAQVRPHLAVMHVFSHVGVLGNEGADTLASASLDQHPSLSLKPEQPAQPLTPTRPT